jgi:hypothetical protein
MKVEIKGYKLFTMIQYSHRHSLINHGDRCITHLHDINQIQRQEAMAICSLIDRFQKNH